MKIRDIAELVSGELIGDGEVEIERVAKLSSAASGELAFVDRSDGDPATGASCVLVPTDFEIAVPGNYIRVAKPKLAFTLAAEKLRSREAKFGERKSAIAESADVQTPYIGSFVSIGENSSIGEGCEIGDGVRIGRNVTIKRSTIIYPNCVIYDGVEIGSGCVIHAGTVLGSDGFGYVRDETGRHRQFPQVGTLVVEDNVEIGANCTIDRGSLGETRIGTGTKIDNLVHIAHNVEIGKRVLIAGQSGIAGSSTIGDDVVIAGQVGISDHVRIESGVVIGAKSVVFPNKIIKKGAWSGIPVQPMDEYKTQLAQLRSIGRLRESVRRMQKHLGLDFSGKDDTDR